MEKPKATIKPIYKGVTLSDSYVKYNKYVAPKHKKPTLVPYNPKRNSKDDNLLIDNEDDNELLTEEDIITEE